MDAKYDVKDNTHVPGSVLHIYFNDFADPLDLRRCIRFNTRVLGVEKLVHDQDQRSGLADHSANYGSRTSIAVDDDGLLL
ncbi:hypothetical protein MAP00_004479 [Monascus purpureus]|nr:hypothetical protein MAP00_004479 [Monascus purpureus]